jgi:hypothetical protein
MRAGVRHPAWFGVHRALPPSTHDARKERPRGVSRPARGAKRCAKCLQLSCACAHASHSVGNPPRRRAWARAPALFLLAGVFTPMEDTNTRRALACGVFHSPHACGSPVRGRCRPHDKLRIATSARGCTTAFNASRSHWACFHSPAPTSARVGRTPIVRPRILRRTDP